MLGIKVLHNALKKTLSSPVEGASIMLEIWLPAQYSLFCTILYRVQIYYIVFDPIMFG